MLIRKEAKNSMESKERYNHEKVYWDRRISGVLKDTTHDFKLPHLLTFIELCKTIDSMSPIINFWGSIGGKKILDLACGDGWLSLSMGKSGAIVYGCDISPNLVEIAKRYAKVNSLGGTVHFKTMTAEEMTYKDNFFDFVIMHAALHHCDIEKTSRQIHRVLKPGGKAVLIEDYAYHPLMNLYRRFTPHKHTKHEKALSDKDLEIFVSPFSSHFYTYFGLFNIFETSHNKLICKIKPFLRSLDKFLYTAVPYTKRYSKLIGIFVVK